MASDVRATGVTVRSASSDRSGRSALVPVVAVIAMLVAVAADVTGESPWHRPSLFAALTGGAALLALVVSTAVVAFADRTDTAEQGLLGSVVMSAAVLSGVHAVLTPGVIVVGTEGFESSSLPALSLAAAVGAPLLLRSTSLGRVMARRWRPWTLVGLTVVFIAGALVVAAPDVLGAPGRSHPVRIVVAVATAVAFGMLAVARRRLAGGARSADAVAAASLSLMAGGALAPLAVFGSPVWWTGHMMTAVGLVGAALGLAGSSRGNRSVRSLFSPVIERDPLLALDLDASPVVRRAAEELEQSDSGRRTRTVLSTTLAMRVGERCGLSDVELRDLGLAGLLHETGKPETVRGLLSERRRLTDDELDLIRAHPVDGAEVLAGERLLSGAAPLVRSHHERVDGTGFPDRLAGQDIPIGSRIIAVCDALTALALDRPYRRALPLAIAVGVLREHAGAQWDERIVEHTIAVLPEVWTGQVAPMPADADPTGVVAPDDLTDLLASIDIEI